MALAGEASELLEIFQWLTPGTIEVDYGRSGKKRRWFGMK